MLRGRVAEPSSVVTGRPVANNRQGRTKQPSPVPICSASASRQGTSRDSVSSRGRRRRHHRAARSVRIERLHKALYLSFSLGAGEQRRTSTRIGDFTRPAATARPGHAFSQGARRIGRCSCGTCSRSRPTTPAISGRACFGGKLAAYDSRGKATRVRPEGVDAIAADECPHLDELLVRPRRRPAPV